MTTILADTNHADRHIESRPQTPAQTTFESRTPRQFDLRIVAFMVVVGVVQLLTFKRPFS